jgi:hypothetical protein
VKRHACYVIGTCSTEGWTTHRATVRVHPLLRSRCSELRRWPQFLGGESAGCQRSATDTGATTDNPGHRGRGCCNPPQGSAPMPRGSGRPSQITNAVTWTDNEPMDALRSFNERLRILREETPHASEADLREVVEGAMRVIVTRAKNEREQQRKPETQQTVAVFEVPREALHLPESRRAARQDNSWTPFRQDAAGSGIRGRADAQLLQSSHDQPA